MAAPATLDSEAKSNSAANQPLQARRHPKHDYCIRRNERHFGSGYDGGRMEMTAENQERVVKDPALERDVRRKSSVVKDFDVVYGAEVREILDLPADKPRHPTVDDGMAGLALSGGGIRSASFCLGVMQALNADGVLKKFNYLSTVSGGGYIGSAMTVSMSNASRDAAADKKLSHETRPVTWRFPFGQTGQEVGETDETRRLRDRSRYLLQDGFLSALSAISVYLRGVVTNALIVFPLLLVAAAALVALAPTTQALMSTPSHRLFDFGTKHWEWTLHAGVIYLFVLIAYAFLVSNIPILSKWARNAGAVVALCILTACFIPVFLEIHFAILRIMFGPEALGISQAVDTSGGKIAIKGPSGFENIARVAVWGTPLVLAVLPFVKQLAQKAVTTATHSASDALAKWASRLLLIGLAAIVPLVLWMSILQLAYWGIGVTACSDPRVTGCEAWGGVGWNHAPGFVQSLRKEVLEIVVSLGLPWEPTSYRSTYIWLAAFAFLLWLFLNVNSNSLHQLYRDRLGSAFLFKRRNGVVEGDDRFKLSDIVSGASPYHLINAAVNLPGSRFANKRGRNADFFIFSKRYVGSEATGYVDTVLAEKSTDGLNVGTAMAISGAAAAPNMGMVSMRPLSATIALLNVRLGRWVRHPADMVRFRKLWAPVSRWLGAPGPLHLLKEAFFKSGAAVAERSPDDTLPAGFIFLTDGGHIENLGVYELLRRRCALIVAVDAEADPDYTSSSLVQLQRFARIDLGTRIVMEWQPIGETTKTFASKLAAGTRTSCAGPHVAVGVIDYPPATDCGERQKGLLVYVKSSMSGDEADYVVAYKARNPAFPQESTMEQLFSEEQFEAYRALGEHITRRFVSGKDHASAAAADVEVLRELLTGFFPDAKIGAVPAAPPLPGPEPTKTPAHASNSATE
jgi:hypothetical protein